MSKTQEEFKSLVQTSGASGKRSGRGLMSKVLDPGGFHTDTSQPIIKGSGFKMTGFPQHAGVSPMRDDVRTTVKREDLKRSEPKTKLGEFVRKHPKLDKAVGDIKRFPKKAWKKANEFAKTDAGKAVIAGLTRKATAPRPKKEVTAIISGEQKSIM